MHTCCSHRHDARCLTFGITLLASLLLTATAAAQDSPTSAPKEVEVSAKSVSNSLRPTTQFLAGIRFAPGFFATGQPATKTKKATDDSTFAAAAIQLSVMQFFLPEVSLAGELYFGGVFIDQGKLTATKEPATVRPNLGAGLTLRYYPLPETVGFFLGASLGAEWFFLSNSTYSSYAVSPVVGWKFLIGEHIVQADFGYTTPIIGGVSANAIPIEQSTPKPMPPQARMHQFFFALNFAF